MSEESLTGSRHAASTISAIVVMGPSACGKSTLGKAAAEALGWRFIEGDEHHPPENLVKMRGGEPLAEADRMPFLAAIGRRLADGEPAVASCSALRRAHRDLLRGFRPGILFVWIDVPERELARRAAARRDHFMPASLLESQLATLEPPTADENFLKVDGSLAVEDQVKAVCQHLSGYPAG